MNIKHFFLKTMIVFFTGSFFTLNAQGLLSHHFNDGGYGGFEIPKADQEARVNIVNKRVETTWDQDLYNGTNSGRKAQIRPDGNNYHFTQEFWTGYWLKIHNNTLASNTNTEMCLMQIWGHNDATGAANHYAMLKYDGRNGGALVWQHRYNSVANIPQFLVYPNFPKDTFVKVVIRVKLGSLGNGTIQIWIDDELRLSLYNQTIGWGDMNNNGMYNQTYSSISYGQYNYMANSTTMETYDKSSHTFNGHQNGETRTVTYDTVTLWDGDDGYDVVHPQGNSHPQDNYSITKRNASSYGLNGGGGGSNGQNISLHSSTNHANLTWTEINRGGGYYSYQKLNTNYCIDGGGNGSNGQNVKLWSCDEMNYNQQWKKVNVGSGFYLLEKRNASNYALDGSNGGTNGQNVKLWSKSTTQWNQHWKFNASSNSNAKSAAVEKESESINGFNVYPNPVNNELTLSLSEYDDETTIKLFSVNGKKVIDTKPNNEVTKLDLSTLESGVYILKVHNKSEDTIKKVIKL